MKKRSNRACSARRLRGHLNYANLMATAAVFVVLGGGAYAATALPKHSVGSKQLRNRAVVGSKIAPQAVKTQKLKRGGVTLNRLSSDVRDRLDAAGQPGPQGPQGETGPRGPAGADALGAVAVRYDEAATGSPSLSTVLDMPGLKLRASCELTGGDVTLDLHGEAPEASTLENSIVIDAGSDPANPPPPGDPGTGASNNQTTLAANTDTDMGGPATDTGSGLDYFRAHANLVAISPSRTITLQLVAMVNATSGRCSLNGSALPTS